MENSERIVELLTESLQRLDQMVVEQKESNRRLNQQSEKQEKMFQSIERHLIDLNVQTVENTRAIFKLAEKVEGIAELHKRVTKLEKEVFK